MSRRYLIVSDGIRNVPVFYNNPEYYIDMSCLSDRFKTTNRKAKDICISNREDKWGNYISFFDKKKSHCNDIKKREYQLLNYIRDEEIVAFIPDCTLLNYFTKFCKDNNCLSALYSSLYEIHKIIPNSNPNVIINSDMVAMINHSHDLEFGWINEAAYKELKS